MSERPEHIHLAAFAHLRERLRTASHHLEEDRHNAVLRVEHGERPPQRARLKAGHLQVDELARLEINVDVLTEPEVIGSREELDVKRYGVIVSSGHKRGLLLPDLDGVDSVDEQIAIAMRKGGITARDKITLERFEVVRHH